MWRLCLTTTRAYVLCVWEKQILHHHAHAHTQTRARARARTNTRACAPHTDPLQSSRNKMRRERPHAHKSNSVLLYYLSSIQTSASHKYARAIRAHTHTHTHTSTHTHTQTHARGTGIQSARACIHREREPLLAEWEQACCTIHFLTRYFARRPHTSPVGTGLFPRHYSFTYNFIFTDTLPAESCGTCFSSYICFCFCCYTDTLPAESCGTCFSSYIFFCFCCYTDTLQAARGLGAAALLSRRLLACAQRGGRETLRCI